MATSTFRPGDTSSWGDDVGKERISRSGIQASVEGGDLVVYEDVSLEFAPGAVLVPLGRDYVGVRNVGDRDDEDRLVRVEIHGEILAPRCEIFALSTSSTSDAHDTGLILLAGSRIREVYPEWWGAVSMASPECPNLARQAIQAAFDAAHRHRLRPLRKYSGLVLPSRTEPELRRMPSIPIVLTGSYTIIGEVSFGLRRDEVGAPPNPLHPVNTAGFILRGEHGVGSVGIGRANFLSPGVAWPPSLGETFLAIRGPSGFTVQNVSFNGADQAPRCVDVVNPVAGGAGVFEGVLLRECALRCRAIEGEPLDVGAPRPDAGRVSSLPPRYGVSPRYVPGAH